MAELTVTKKTSARVPTAEGEFRLALYTSNPDDKEHLVLLIGDVAARQDVLVRVHSETVHRRCPGFPALRLRGATASVPCT